VFPLEHAQVISRRLRKVVASILGHRYLADRHAGLLRGFANEASQKLAEKHYDIIFSPSTLPIAYLHTRKPITVCADATFHSMVDYYPSYSRLTRTQREFSEELEHRTLQRASLLIYSSDWAAQSAISHYGVAKERVVVLPSGANFGAKNTRADATRWIEQRSFGSLRLLFVGNEWKRKGGDITFDTLRLLRKAGHNASLDIVGCIPPPNVVSHSHVRTHGHLSIGNDQQRSKLDSLFARAHFLLVPSRAEAFGMVFCEANAFALPAISSDTGGIPTIIHNGLNGYTLSRDVGAAEYAKLLGNFADDLDRYRRLAESSFAEFEQRLNWNVWINRYLEMVDRLPLADAQRI
jgi:glycosyltransferase involved in cell wall biosynthesis